MHMGGPQNSTSAGETAHVLTVSLVSWLIAGVLLPKSVILITTLKIEYCLE